jgi:putative SOS response-associated peptidase YedK
MQKRSMKQTPNFAGFWSPLFTQQQVTYLTFIFLTLETLTKLKTTFGRNLLHSML